MAPSRRGEGAGGTGAPGLTAANGPDGGLVAIMGQKRQAHDKAIQVCIANDSANSYLICITRPTSMTDKCLSLSYLWSSHTLHRHLVTFGFALVMWVKVQLRQTEVPMFLTSLAKRL